MIGPVKKKNLVEMIRPSKQKQTVRIKRRIKQRKKRQQTIQVRYLLTVLRHLH